MSGKAETRAGTDPRSAAQVGHQRGAEDLSLGIEEILHLILNVSAQCPETDFRIEQQAHHDNALALLQRILCF
jgi:hypothetical protein